MAIPCRG